jgi:predicted Zn-dependent protease
VQFERGRHVKEGGEEWIDIFQFEDKANLLVTLAHELGHALGIGHNANPASIMSPLIHTDHLALTAEDEAGLKDACSLN